MKLILAKRNRIPIPLLCGIMMCFLTACGFVSAGEKAESDPLYTLTPARTHTGAEMDADHRDTISDVDSTNQERLSKDHRKKDPLFMTESFKSILLENGEIMHCSDDGKDLKSVTIGDIENVFTSSDEITGEVTGFAIVDLDCDGEKEIVLKISTGSIDEGYEVLHYQGNIVYGYHFWYRVLEDLKEDGTFISSGGASSNTINRIEFCENGYVIDTLYEDGEACSEKNFCDAIDRQFEKASVIWYELTEGTVVSALDNNF